ncbi:MAG: hypothetical protein OEZ15_08515 [Gammaproteobacteria bacterium]|nr:hypothetical protein [Gammaproteobacteria bacterium]
MKTPLATRRFINFLLLLAIVLSAGCTTYVGKVDKLDGYDKKLVQVAVAWHRPVKLKTEITKSSQGGSAIITPQEKIDSKQGIDTLLSLFSVHSVQLVTDGLRNNGVTLAKTGDQFAQKLNLVVHQSRTECVPLGCTHNLWIRASILDFELKRFVWTGYFKVGAPYSKQSDIAAIESFSRALIDELKNSELI